MERRRMPLLAAVLCSPVWQQSSLLAAVLCSLAICLPPPADGCMETAWTNGHLDQETAIQAFTLASPRGTTSCACCAFCHQNAACASFSFNKNSKECLLFDTVANYSTIIANWSWVYFVMPGRSQHQQFCRQDSDCQVEGDFCRGRVCTDLTAITCRVIYETFGAGDRLGNHVQLHGWLNAEPLALQCRMADNWPGFTRLFRNQQGSSALTRDNIRSYNRDMAGGTRLHSILDLAEDIRQLRGDATYELRTVAKCSDDHAYSDQHLIQLANVSRSQPVLVERPDGTPVDPAGVLDLSRPFLTPSGEDIISVKVNIDLEGDSSELITLPLARTDALIWFQSVSLYIRE